MFGINELTIYQGEWDEATYCVSGDILDGVSCCIHSIDLILTVTLIAVTLQITGLKGSAVETI